MASTPIEYEQRYEALMAQAPPEIERFCDPAMAAADRLVRVKWLRSLDEESMQRLQIQFSFSVPTHAALSAVLKLRRRILSCGAGTGYWERLLFANGADVQAFDLNDTYPKAMRHFPIETGEAHTFVPEGSFRVLFLAWPDIDSSSTFGYECVKLYTGDTVVHVGELFGTTRSATVWGQSTSRACQELLAESFCCTDRVVLPRWPGQCDELTVWKRYASPAVACDGAEFRYVPQSFAP